MLAARKSTPSPAAIDDKNLGLLRLAQRGLERGGQCSLLVERGDDDADSAGLGFKSHLFLRSIYYCAAATTPLPTPDPGVVQ